MVKDMDKWLEKYALLSKSVSQNAYANVAGTGAAGGLGFAFLAYTNAAVRY